MTGLKKAINNGPDYLKGIIRQICEVVLIPIGTLCDPVWISQVNMDKGTCFKMKEKNHTIEVRKKNR